jgi:hypothetical protein
LDRPAEKRRQWQGPGRRSAYSGTPPGPNRLYNQTDFVKELKRVLTDANFITYIHSLLLESRLLPQLMTYFKLVSFWVMKNNQGDIKRAWRICKSVFPIFERHSGFEKDFKKVITVKDKKELEKMASQWALAYVTKHLPDDYYSLFFVGAFYFF